MPTVLLSAASLVTQRPAALRLAAALEPLSVCVLDADPSFSRMVPEVSSAPRLPSPPLLDLRASPLSSAAVLVPSDSWASSPDVLSGLLTSLSPRFDVVLVNLPTALRYPLARSFLFGAADAALLSPPVGSALVAPAGLLLDVLAGGSSLVPGPPLLAALSDRPLATLLSLWDEVSADAPLLADLAPLLADPAAGEVAAALAADAAGAAPSGRLPARVLVSLAATAALV